ncbi:hypothetical protein AVEN_108487-1 [Araneus ventricosus]|uniref:Uncharacterized protein n=1 Tax=Araneus ventricosus TaxID=182803 RepID=A0A4Y2UP47_ARAVE|nr:hypothetical protein AVEN_108487-1 [Araneus ventricosus]
MAGGDYHSSALNGGAGFEMSYLPFIGLIENKRNNFGGLFLTYPKVEYPILDLHNFGVMLKGGPGCGTFPARSHGIVVRGQCYTGGGVGKRQAGFDSANFRS